jgi:hypothetical protein
MSSTVTEQCTAIPGREVLRAIDAPVRVLRAGGSEDPVDDRHSRLRVFDAAALVFIAVALAALGEADYRLCVLLVAVAVLAKSIALGARRRRPMSGTAAFERRQSRQLPA